MIASVLCPCSARHVVTSVAVDSRPLAMFVARLVAVAHEWAVDVEAIGTNTIGGVCAVCRARSKVALYQEMR